MHGRHNLHFKLHIHGRKHFYRRPQVVHPCVNASLFILFVSSSLWKFLWVFSRKYKWIKIEYGFPCNFDICSKPPDLQKRRKEKFYKSSSKRSKPKATNGPIGQKLHFWYARQPNVERRLVVDIRWVRLI